MNSNKKENRLDRIDSKLRIVKVVFIIILVFPFVFYLAPKVDFSFEKEKLDKPVEVISEKPAIVNGVDVETGLVVDDGYEIVKGTCGACHSLNLVTQNSATREGWKEIIVWMQETQKLWDLGESEVVILDYLEKNYAPKEQGRRAPLKNIEWYEL